MKVLGVMTGTSCDGLDTSCLLFEKKKIKILWSKSAPYPENLRKRVLEIQKPGVSTTLKDLLCLDRDLGLWYGKILNKMISHAKEKPDVIANHGQTIAHFPKEHVTLQLGNPAIISHLTGLTVVSRFREGDQSAGGQGAPLVPLYHKKMVEQYFPKENAGVAIHNLGGMSNLTYVSPRGRVLAFDTGPGNIWIDQATEWVTGGREKKDRGGKHALSGKICFSALKKILNHPFFSAPPPKSCGRNDFPFEFFLTRNKIQDENLIATATAVTTETIARAYEKWILKRGSPLKEIYLCGGGSKNKAILSGLQERLPMVQINPIEKLGLDSKYLEAQAFAYFGYLSLQGMALGGPWTGAYGFGSPGQILSGRNGSQIFA